MDYELPLLWASMAVYVGAGCLAIVSLVFRRDHQRTELALLLAGLGLLTLSIAMRWVRLGHGPFLTMFEILLSNFWSLAFVFTLAYWRMPALRPTAAIVLPMLFVMMAWLLVTDPTHNQLPPTYDTVWLYIHIGFAKVFIGAMLVAVGLAGVILIRLASVGRVAFARMPSDASLDELAYRFVVLGLIFDTLMLITGAIWAQDAWGRYWAWDPLETWAFITWLILALAIHMRVTFKLRPVHAAWLVIAVFVIAFLTFFGIPFLTEAPHKGAF